MGSQPNLVLQLARAIGDLRDIEIHAVTAVSLDGRAPAPMIDPTMTCCRSPMSGERMWVPGLVPAARGA